ncbi:angiopoietin-related protein 6-like [Watersipora subatra]|uniref:angiopoietin-related protein 6-like n=1 Tax=Watersipora subatra TaxID=2589382 RepID=UPI00355C09B1
MAALKLLVLFFIVKIILARKHPRDCQDIRLSGHKKSGVYKIFLPANKSVEVFCEHGVNKSYTVIQQRTYGNINFQRTYGDYQIGFGDLQGDFWAGLTVMNHLTTYGNTVMDVQLIDWNGNQRSGTYAHFVVGPPSDRYRLQIGGFYGNMVDDLSYNNNMQFSTYDYPDVYNCAVNQRVGWWYNYCSYALLNGFYYSGGPYTPSGGFYDGIYWKDWLGFGYSLKYTRMLVSQR